MQLPHCFSKGQNPAIGRFLAILFAFPGLTVAVAEESNPPKVVALDHPTADLLRACFPAMEFEVLVRFENEPNATINQRAWLTRDADVLVFRSDQISIRSRLFRERLMMQGIRAVDLKAHVSINRALQFRLDGRGPKIWRSDLEQFTADHGSSRSDQVEVQSHGHPVASLTNRSSCSSDVHLPRVSCPPHETGMESQRQALAKAYKSQSK